MGDQIVETQVYNLSIKIHHHQSATEDPRQHHNNKKHNQKRDKLNTLDLTNLPHSESASYDTEELSSKAENSNYSSSSNCNNLKPPTTSSNSNKSSPRVPRISLSILQNNNNSNSNSNNNSNSNTPTNTSGDSSPLIDSKSSARSPRTPRSSPSTPKKSKSNKMEGTPTNGSTTEVSSSKYSPLSLISPRKKGKKDKNKHQQQQQQQQQQQINDATIVNNSTATTTPTTTSAATSTTTLNGSTTPNSSLSNQSILDDNSSSNMAASSYSSNNILMRDDLDSPLSTSSSITASISTDSLHQTPSLKSETVLSPPPVALQQKQQQQINPTSSYNYHPIPSEENSSAHTSSTSLLDDFPSSSNSTPILQNQSSEIANESNNNSNNIPTQSNTVTAELLLQQNNPKVKKGFFSFLSRKSKPPPPSSMNIERNISVSSPPSINSASSTPQITPNLNGINTTPSYIHHHPLHHQMQQPRRMSASLDSLKIISPSITPNYVYSPIASPVPPSPLKTSILRNRSNSSSFYSNGGGGGSSGILLNGSGSGSGSFIKKFDSSSNSSSNSSIASASSHQQHTYHPHLLPILTPSINSPYPNNNIGSSQTSISVATDATWLMIVSNWEEWSEPHYRSTLTKYVYQGIPDRFRPTIWFHLSNMIQQNTRIPSCTELTLQYRFERFQPQLTPLSTPSNMTPISTPLIKSQSSSSILPPTSLSTSNGKEKENSKDTTTTTNTTPPQSTSYSPLTHSSPSCKNHKCFYQSILKHNSEHEEQIEVDIQRSFTDLTDNSIRETYSMQLSRVLKAISLYDTEMGYCQGISFVGSILITKVPEEETFHILLRLLEGVMRDFYTVGMRGLKLRLYQLSKFVKDLFPKLHNHLEQIDLDYTIFASPWFMTAFSYHLSEECSVRILDVILLQGVEAFFSVGLAIFQIIESDLLKCTDSSQVMEYFRCNAKENIDVNTLMDIACRITISPHQLANYKAQFEALNTKPSIPTEFNPDQQPKEKLKDPNWVVKKYKLKEYINALEEDLAIIKRELHETHKKTEEEKYELVKHLQEISERENLLIDQKRISDSNYLLLQQENEELKKKLHKSEECNNFLAEQMRVLRTKVTQELWNNNPKNSIQWS